MLEQMGIQIISLADTVGMATSERVAEVVSAVNAKYDYLEIGVHLHSRPAQVMEKIIAAHDAGARRFDSAIGGLGGCPFAQDAMVGNIPTEKLLDALARLGLELPVTKPLNDIVRMSADIAARFGSTAAAD
jgi:hydroxymethylglutaryl-CoA lyase